MPCRSDTRAARTPPAATTAQRRLLLLRLRLLLPLPLLPLLPLLLSLAGSGCRACASGRQQSGEEQARGRIEALLMGAAEYRALVKGPPGQRFLHLSCGPRHLFYAGFQHSTDPENPAFRDLEGFFARFAQATAGRPRAVLVEGRLRALEPTREAAISRAGGEGGLVTRLAHLSGISELACPEPRPQAQLAALKQRFGADAACYAFWARTVALWQRRAPRPALENTVRDLWGEDVAGCDFSEPAMAGLHARLFGRPLELADHDHFARVTDPLGEGPINRVLAEDTRWRDVLVVEEIARRWSRGQSLFVVFGAAHAAMQERALRALLCEGCPGGRCHVEVGP